MTSIKKKLALQFGKRSVLALLVLALVFWSALAILFTQEKQRLDTEFGGMILDSLSIHTRRNAEQISKLIRDAERALKTARTMLRNGGSDGSIPERLAPRNALAPDYPTQYLSEEELAAGALHTGEGNTRQRLTDGEAAIDIIFDAALGGITSRSSCPSRMQTARPARCIPK